MGDPTRRRFQCRKLDLGSYFIFASPLQPSSVEAALLDLPPGRVAQVKKPF